MEENYVQLVGGPCGQHGPYTFYKAFKFTKNGVKRIMTLSEFFFVKLWMDSDLVCIGELQLLWVDKNSDQALASLRLYFLPENTPEGRMDHGEDEVLAISEKVVLRVEDLITWITLDAEWGWGRPARYVECTNDALEIPEPRISARLTESSLDFSDVEREKKLSDIKPSKGPAVIILSYPRYCRYRAILKRLEGVADDQLKHRFVNALGGIRVKNDHTHILYCRDTFDYPELEGHELLCNHLAPKLKGRPRGKRKKRSISPGSESNESESSVSNAFSSGKNKLTIGISRNGLRCDSNATRRSTRSSETNAESKDFIKQLTTFMKNNKTPIGRIPCLGYRELDLHSFYLKVENLGGYDNVTVNRLWKSIFDELSGNLSSTSAATVIRKHYERFLLPYERHIKGEEDKPLAVSERRRPKSKTGSSSASMSDAETSEGTSRSGNSTPVPQVPCSSSSTPSTPTEVKDFNNIALKMETTKSLRSVRVKSDRMRENKDMASGLLSIQEENMEVPFKEEMAIPDKDPEPTIGAVAPVQKMDHEKSTSLAECKENIPLFNDIPNTQQASTTTVKNNDDEDDDLIEVPYKPKSPEVIDLESDYAHNGQITNNNNNCITNNKNSVADLKKGKLDILKEGGLEVTPVRNMSAGDLSAIRTLSIHKMTHEKQHMPPPSINATLIKRPPSSAPARKSSGTTIPANFSPIAPRKVVQSTSIYKPSQKMIYGDPKHIMHPQIHQVQTPKFVGSTASNPAATNYKSVTDLLDLTVKSPQKPAVEIMPVPPALSPKMANKMHYPTPPALPLLEGRRLNNLEITLVNPTQLMQQQRHMPPMSPHLPPHMQMQQPPMHVPKKQRYMPPQHNKTQYKPPQQQQPLPPNPKRQQNDFYQAQNKMVCMEENGKRISAMPNMYPQQSKPATKGAKYAVPPTTPMIMPNYTLPVTATSSTHAKSLPPPFPMLDPMYYQGLYSQLQPGFPLPGSDNLQYLSELMARNRIPGLMQGFPLLTEQHASIASADNKTKKP